MARRRLLGAGALILLLAECALFLYLVVVGWAFRSLMLPPGDPEIAVRIRTVVANGAWLALNVIGLLVYVSRKDGVGRRVIQVVLAFDIANSLLAGVEFIVRGDPTTAAEWWLLALVPALALGLVLMQRRGAAVG